MRHRTGQPLSMLWDAAGAGWQRAISGKTWVTVQDASGVVGWVRVWEVTDGVNGWHVHVHFVMVLRAGAMAEDLDRAAVSMFGRWSKGLVASGLEAPRRVGQEWHLVNGDQAAGELTEYLFKIAEQSLSEQALSLGLELTHSMPGRSSAGHKTRPVWSLIEDFVETGEVAMLKRWGEWERASKGRRQVGMSRGLRARFAPSVKEMTDEQIASQEVGTVEDDLVRFTRVGWGQMVRRPQLMAEALDAAEAGGMLALRQLLDVHGIDYEVVEHGQ
jgi:hypothetical protein